MWNTKLDTTFLKDAWEMATKDGQFLDLGIAVLENLIVPAGLLAAGSVAGYLTHRRIRKGQFETVTVGETYFIPSGVINPKTGEEYVNMHRNTLDANFSFPKAFHGSMGRELAKTMSRAVKKLDTDHRIAFPLVETIVGEKHAQKYNEIISSHWKGYFGSFLNDEIGLHSPRLKGREKPEQNPVLVLPVWEEGSKSSHYKVLCIPPSFMKSDGLPKRENVRVQVAIDEDGKRIFDYQPGHEAYTRLDTLREIRNKIAPDLPAWLNSYGVSVFTGRMEIVPEPPRPAL